MNVYLIKNNTVENVVVVDSMESAQDLFPDYIIVGVADNEADIGWTYAEGLFAPPDAANETLEETVARHDTEIGRPREMKG